MAFCGKREAETIAGFEDTLAAAAGNPWLQAMILFLGPFVLEEAALMAGALMAAAEELPAWVALGVLYAGIVVSDWALYALGFYAGRSRRLRRFVEEENLARGKDMLHQNLTSALFTARLIPWLLFPVLVSCGFLRVGFSRFAAISAGIALVYSSVLFWLLLAFDVLLLEYLDAWGWVVAIAMIVGIAVFSHVKGKRQKARIARDSSGPGHDRSDAGG